MKTKCRTSILLFAYILLCVAILSCTEKTVENTPVHQLRIYEVPKENIQVFHERFRDHAHRIMKKYGFTIVSIWESRNNEKVEFVYLLQWKDQKSMEDSWEKFMADQEWKDIKKETGALHGSFVENIEDRTLTLTDYSPHMDLLE